MITIRDLHKSYDTAQGRFAALSGIDLDIGCGEVFGIIGPSGAGKSTLVQCINLLEAPDRGEIELGGERLTGLSETRLRRHRRRIGMVFQGFNLLHRRTVHGNVALPLEIAGLPSAEIGRRVPRLLEMVGLAALADRYPAQISGGQKQRVGIARALANEPDVLLSDEATSALDPETTRSILALLREINRATGITVVMITHQMDVVRQVCDRIAVLDHGRVVEQGGTAEIFARPRHPVTRTMVSAVTASELDAETMAALRGALASPGLPAGERAELWRLRLAGEAATGLVGALGRDELARVRLVQARLEPVRATAVGTVFVRVDGREAALDALRAGLEGRGAVVERVLP